MPKRTDISPILVVAAALLLAGCVNTRVFSRAELSAVARQCGVAEGEVMQEEELPRMLFLYAVAPSREQTACVRKWSRKRRMNLALIEAIDGPAEPANESQPR